MTGSDHNGAYWISALKSNTNGTNTGLAFYGGYSYAAWADNLNQTGNNTNGVCAMDIYVAKGHF